MKRTPHGSEPVPSLRRTPYVRTLIVLGTFAVLLAYVLLVEVKREPRSDQEATPTPWPILDHSIEDLSALHITDGERTLRIERSEAEAAEGSEWRITEGAGVPLPSNGVVDADEFRFPIGELMSLEARRVVLDQVSDPAIYGLDVPTMTVTIETQSGDGGGLNTPIRIYVGRETPDGTALYVQREGDPRLYIVAHYKLESLFEWLSDPPYQPTPTPTK